jgi:hypothetical protein
MQIVKCVIHNEKFTLPTETHEYYLGKYHTNIELLCKHRESHHDCKFEEMKK